MKGSGREKDGEESPKKQGKSWLLYAWAAAFFFTICNASISEITSKVGPLCILYFASGSIVTGLVYNMIECVKNKRKGGKFWNDQNLIVGGRLKFMNVFGFFIFCCNYFAVQNLAFLTMYYARKAEINVGVITTIWSVNPLFIAVADYFLFATKLKYYHTLGTLSIVVCTVVLSVAGLVNTPETAELVPTAVRDILAEPLKSTALPSWIPVLFGVITPISFTTSGMLVKHLTQDRIGFDPSTLSFSSYVLVNVVVIIGAIPYWINVSFDPYLFWLGLVGSIINTLGIVCIQNALAVGPAGPASAITTVSNMMLVVIEAIKNKQVPSPMEFIGLAFGMYGALVLVIPGFFEKYICCCCKCGDNEQESEETDTQLNNESPPDAIKMQDG